MVAIPIDNMNLRNKIKREQGEDPKSTNWDELIEQSSFLTLVEGSRTLCTAQFIPFGEYGIEAFDGNAITDDLARKDNRKKVVDRARASLIHHLVRCYPLGGNDPKTANTKSIYRLAVVPYTHEKVEGILTQVEKRK